MVVLFSTKIDGKYRDKCRLLAGNSEKGEVHHPACSNANPKQNANPNLNPNPKPNPTADPN